MKKIFLSLCGALVVAAAYPATLNIKSFGAVGDGAHDDSAALRAALASASLGDSIYIPPGVFLIDPASGPFTIQSSLTIKGDGLGSVLRVKDGDGDFDYIFRPLTFSTEVDNITFTNFVIDQNIGKNPTATPVASPSHGAQTAIWIGNFSNVLIDAVRFLRCGGVNTVVLSGGGQGAVIQNCVFTWQKPAGGHPGDVSMIYTNCRRQLVKANSFGSTFADRAVTAIECHGSGITISANRVNSFRKGMNVTSFNPSSSFTSDGNIDISGNILTVCTAGISLWSFNSRTLSNVQIHDNVITVAPAQTPDQAVVGIGTVRDASGNVSGDYSWLIIRHNTITYSGTDNATTLATIWGHSWSAYDVGGITLSQWGHVSNSLISDNVISGAIHQGIVVGDTSGVDDSRPRMQQVTVQNNRLSGMAPITANSNPLPAGVVVQGLVDHVILSNNRATFRFSYGMQTKFNNARGWIQSGP